MSAPPIILKVGIETSAAIAAVKDFGREASAAVNGSFTTSVEKAQKSLEDLTRKLNTQREVISQYKQMMDKASQAEQENLKKVIALHELEILKIQEKRTKQQEIISLSTTSSEAERKAIKGSTDDRNAAIAVMKDQTRAQIGINDEVDKGTDSLDMYFSRFTGIGAFIAMLGALKTAFADTRQQMEEINQAVEHFQSLNSRFYQMYKSFYNEAGISGGAAQDRARDMLDAIAKKTNLDQSTVAQASTAMAPVLKERGIAWDSAQGQSIITNAAILTDKGVDASQIKNVASDMTALNGNDLNASVASTIAATGSPSRANELYGAYYQNKEKAGAVGLGISDVTKMFMFLHGQKGESPEQIPQDIGRALQAMDRMVGLDPTEKLALQQKLSEDGAGGLAAHMGSVPKFMAAFQQLSPAKREVVAREIAGPRGVVAMNAIAGYGAMQLPSAGPLSAPDNLAQVAESRKQGQDADAATMNASQPGATEFQQASLNETQYLDRNRSLMPWYARNPKWGALLTLGTNATNTEVGARMALGRQFIKTAQDARSATTPQDKAQAQQLLGDYYERLNVGLGSNDIMSASMSALRDGTSPYYDNNGKQITRNSVLDGLQNEDQIQSFLSGELNFWGGTGSAITDPQAAGKLLDRSHQLHQQIQQRPTTRPSTPTSINYHIRQTNYGYENSAIGAPMESPNNFG